MKRWNFVLALSFALCGGVTAWTQQGAPTSAEALQQVRRYSLQARASRLEMSPDAVASVVRTAIVADSENSELHRALGDVYLFQVRSSAGASPNIPDLLAAMQRATAAYERAIQLDPANAVALSSHGLLLTIGAFLQQKPELAAQGIGELDRAVELGPRSLVPRLNRAFTGVNLPPQLRNTSAVTEDLKFLITVAEGSRAGDMVHLLLGDLYAETGKLDDARAQYAAATRRPATAAREAVATRLAALDKGTLPTAEIMTVRGSIVTDCVMCHAQ